jgi:hypothetical protein
MEDGRQRKKLEVRSEILAVAAARAPSESDRCEEKSECSEVEAKSFLSSLLFFLVF